MHLSKSSRIILLISGAFVLLPVLINFGQIVLAQSPGSEDTSVPNFFIEAEIDNLTPYVGQQITYSLKRYQATEFPNHPYYEDKPIDGFWEAPLIQRPSYTTTISGREYLVHPTYFALFPLAPGPVTIDPVKLIIPGNSPETDITLQSHSVKLQVQPLPEGAARHFRGAVGQFEISAKFSTNESQVDEAINLIVEVKGIGNIETMLEPVLPTLEHWTWAGSFWPQAKVTTNVPLSKEMVQGSRQFEWYMVPLQAGKQFFPAIRFSYFDPQANAYQTIRTNPIPITVLQNPNSSTFASPLPGQKQEIRRLAGDIRHIKPVPVALTTSTAISKVMGQSLYWSCIILPLFTISGAWFWQSWRRRQLANTPQARRRRARHKARKILTTAQQSNTDTYAIVRHALISYLSDKLNQPITGLTSDRLIALLNEIQLNPQLTHRVDTLLSQVDAGRFAPVANEQHTIHSVIAGARILIDDLEKFFSKRGL